MTRRTRRRMIVLGAAAVAGAAAPAWAPPLLRDVDAFRVREILVEGTRFLEPGQEQRLADLAPEASVWDDVRPLEV